MKTKAKRLIIAIPVAGLLMITSGFDQYRGRNPKLVRTGQHHPNRTIPSINDGTPFAIQDNRYVPDQIIVKFKPTVTSQSLGSFLEAYRTEGIKHIEGLGLHVLRVPKDLTAEEMLVTLRLNPDVEYAEPNPRISVLVTPNDTLFSYQYALYNSGQEIGIPGSPQGTARADIKATEGWEETKGSPDIIIAILDSGVDLLHPELADKTVSGGRDFVNDDFDATDDHYHGTMMASMAAADTNNGEGIAGVAWNCLILPVKIVDQEGLGDYATLIEGLMWAADEGADVINLSVGGATPSPSLESALKYAYDKGVVIVAAAGNDTNQVVYPAAYDQYCLAVGATDYNDQRAAWSATGPEIDVAAPGERILGAVPTWFYGANSLPYAFGWGTSAATALVTGLAALIRSNKPWLTNAEVMDVIRFTADDINAAENPGVDEYIGYGRINLDKALSPQIILSSK